MARDSQSQGEDLRGKDEQVVCGDFRMFLQWSLQAEAGSPSSDSLPLPGAPRFHQAQSTPELTSHQYRTPVTCFPPSPYEGARKLWLHAGAVLEGNESHRAGEGADQDIPAGRG